MSPSAEWLRRAGHGLLALLLLGWPVAGSAAPPRDKQRKDLMDQLGMPKKKDPPPQTPKDDGDDGDDDDGGGDDDAGDSTEADGSTESDGS
ncbi:MAG: hypothetical protein KC457_09190, partial [Myxococcales bacterium]|nr:hypothetical protein [Myxococcales bacterium]